MPEQTTSDLGWLWSALAGAAPFVAWWLAVVFVEAMAARAEADGEDTWEDLFWPRLLRRLDQHRYLKRRLEKAGTETE